MARPLIPHADPVRFLREVEVLEDAVRGEALVPKGSPADEQGSVRPGWLIEIAAQTVAAAEAAADGSGQPHRGVLAGVRDWRWLTQVPIDHSVEIRARREAVLGRLAKWSVEVSCGGRLAAAGILQVARSG